MRALIAGLALAVALAGVAPAHAQKNSNRPSANGADNSNRPSGQGAGKPNRGADDNAGSTNRPSGGDPVVYFSDDDTQMNAAMAEAKSTLPQFWLLLANDDIVAETGAVKIGFPHDKGGREYMWVSDLRRVKGVLKGTLDNTPNYDVGYKEGDTVVIKPEDIVDWTYIRNGKMWGGYTLRVMVREMAPDEARELIDSLSDRPLEGDQI